MPDLEDVAEWIDRIGNLVSQVLSTLLIILLIGDLLGINVGQLLITIISRPWVIPWEWIYRYYQLWYGMMWCLAICMIADQIYTMRYTQKHGRPPPPSYVRWMSLAIFMLSFWLALILRYASLVLICIMSAVSFAYTTFVKRS